MSDSQSLSDISISSQSKASISDLGAVFQTSVKNGLKSLKRQNKKAKKVVIKEKEHQSSTVTEHTQIVSVQLQDANGGYLGSAHIDANGTVYPNKNWEKNAGQ